MARALSKSTTPSNNLSFCCLETDDSSNGSSTSRRCTAGISSICRRIDNQNGQEEKGDSKDAGKLTVALMYYAEPAMLLRQLENFVSYPEALRQKIVLLIVDDGSPEPSLTASTYITQDHRAKLDIRNAYIQQNTPWNTPGARNLAFHVATTDSVFMIDADLLIPVETMEKAAHLADLSSSPEAIHTGFIAHQFNRTRPSGEYKVHPSAMLLDVSAFWLSGGCEEDFSGHYGSEDSAFWYR
eukprot:CAMPEP_0117015572 /NCGR_PEP_ID=MMETSP0472-20121206/12417_1 /TAXON_ID=693140 ORGANISM="Tiarina fusus, Strain LIS" /NCGR_SAMPLE_ID=MMETSP0472 /ASSEMBLY_ACC=CAM_ASM_000603 /LENGTH=240 /DNA_ID=CAMNT_0004719405 /DNA_START=230 /DNA_END=947 /DNA_ORIENTATION=-